MFKLNLLILLFFIGCSQKQQIIVTHTSKTDARLEFFDGNKKLLTANAKIGRNGISSEKREGDGKTPSGTYLISTLFAYESQNAKMPLLVANENLICVDDSNSSFYNKIIEKNSTLDIKSYEEMKRHDNQYEFGAVIDYNLDGVKNMGSCIFIHVMNDKEEPTAGCVALNKQDMIFLFKNLDISKKPEIKIIEK
jgi:L,D-peptidoglycan transpeptidase YkuD (ErfK/YbiS/YcfS/YnhG family)